MRVCVTASILLLTTALANANGGVAAPRHGQALTIPFDLVRNQIILAVERDGGPPANFLLDTGVVPSVMDLGLARAAGAVRGEDPIGYAGGVGDGEGAPLFKASLAGFRLAELALDDVDVIAVDMTPLAQRLGDSLGGILGNSFFAGRIVTIDYPGRTVTVGEPPEASLGQPLYEAPLVFVDNDIIPLLSDLRVNGVELAVSMDTGSSLVLELYPEGARRAGVEALSASESTIAGARGSETVLTGQAEQIRLGDASSVDAEVTLPHAARPGNRVGNLGNGFWRDYVLVLDYVDMQIRVHSPQPR